MIPKPARRAIFYYGYRPLSDASRYFPDDGGFSMTLFHDGQLVFDFLHCDGSVYTENVYRLPTEVCAKYLAYVDREAGWLSSIPTQLNMTYDRAPRYESRIGIDGYPLVICDDIQQMMRQPFMDGMGRAARKLCSMMEDISDLFVPQGINLYLNGYACDDKRIQPVEVHTAEDPNWAMAASF